MKLSSLKNNFLFIHLQAAIHNRFLYLRVLSIVLRCYKPITYRASKVLLAYKDII